ncbi:MAG: pacearchaeosortase [Candidatus Pacearchaeota archaeon]|nr:pacearchaeosortase [Candidatus Pacearchaeota archaeon]
MNKKMAFVYSIFLRYLILILAALPNFWIFYFVFTPLTIYPVYFILNLFFHAALSGSAIFIGNHLSPIEIVDACVAGSAYYLLLIFNLSIPHIRIVKRLKMIGFAFLSFLIVNILRIVILSAIFVLNPSIFDISHKLSWYLGSIILVVGIWFLEVKKFKIKEIPFYSDVKSILKYIK